MAKEDRLFAAEDLVQVVYPNGFRTGHRAVIAARLANRGSVELLEKYEARIRKAAERKRQRAEPDKPDKPDKPEK